MTRAFFCFRLIDKRHRVKLDIKLTKATGEYSVVEIINRDRLMILKKTSPRSPLPDIRDYATSCRIAHC
jgi:hypothetical protein